MEPGRGDIDDRAMLFKNVLTHEAIDGAAGCLAERLQELAEFSRDDALLADVDLSYPQALYSNLSCALAAAEPPHHAS